MTYATVAPFARLPVLSDELTYGITPEQLSSIAVGQLVRVRLRGRRTHGVITGLSRQRPSGVTRIEPLAALAPITLPGDLITLARSVRSWYWQPLGLILSSMLPPPLIRWTNANQHALRLNDTEKRPKGLTLSLIGSRGRGC